MITQVRRLLNTEGICWSKITEMRADDSQTWKEPVALKSQKCLKAAIRLRKISQDVKSQR